MPVDASIPLSYQPTTPLMSPIQAQTQALSMRDLMLQTQMHQQQVQQGMLALADQQKLSQVMSNASNIDPMTGMPTQESLVNAGLSPMTMQKLNQARQEAEFKRAEIDLKNTQNRRETFNAQGEALSKANEDAYGEYEAVKKEGGSEEAATEAMRKRRSEEYEKLRGSGLFPSNFQYPDYDAKRTLSGITNYKERKDLESKADTPFMKEAEKLYGYGTPKYYEALQKHVARMDAPTTTMINMGGGMGTSIPSKDQGKNGDEFLATLKPAEAAEVKALAEGRLPISPYALRSKQMWPLIEKTMQYDPSFDASLYQQRQNVRKDFTSGQAARNVTSINTALGHMGTYADLMTAIKNGDTKVINQLVNRISSETGKPEVNNAALAQQAVGDELMRTFRQVGASESEAKDWQQKFATANSPAQASGVARTAAKLLESRIEALDDQWKRGMNSDKGYPNLLSPKSRSTLKKLGVDYEGGDKESAAPASGSAKGSVSQDLLKQYAKQHNMSEDQARSFLKGQGYAVQ